MKSRSLAYLLFVLILATLACGLPSLSQPAIQIDSAATAAAAARQAGVAAATAAALAGDQGGALLATVEASDLNLDIDLEELGQRFGSLQPDANGNVVATITDEEINRALQGQAEISQDDITIQNLRVAFTPGTVVLAGNMTEPIRSGVTASFRPELVDGRVQFTLVSASLGRLPVPTSMVRSIEQTMNTTIGQFMAYMPAGYTLQSVAVDEGSLTVIARQS